MTIRADKLRITISLTKELMQTINEIAERTGRTRSQVIQDNLDYLFNEEWEKEFYKNLDEKK